MVVSGRVFGGMGDFLGAKDEAVEFVLNWMNMLMLQKIGSVEAPQKNEFSRAKCHCCYQVAFQEINILFNRAHLVNCNLFLTESLYRKNYFSKTIKGLLNLTNIHRTIFSGQTYVQK